MPTEVEIEVLRCCCLLGAELGPEDSQDSAAQPMGSSCFPEPALYV